jgi:NADPH:quinone reductase-like Zn-dependent oxidoreductase
MRAVRLHPGGLAVEELEIPRPRAGEALVRVHAAAITRDELTWPVDRLPATPSYELSGVVAAVAPDVDDVEEDEEVFALTTRSSRLRYSPPSRARSHTSRARH